MKMLGIGSMVRCGPQSKVSTGLFSTGSLETHPHLPMKGVTSPIYVAFVSVVDLDRTLWNLVFACAMILISWLRARARALRAHVETSLKYRRFRTWV